MASNTTTIKTTGTGAAVTLDASGTWYLAGAEEARSITPISATKINGQTYIAKAGRIALTAAEKAAALAFLAAESDKRAAAWVETDKGKELLKKLEAEAAAERAYDASRRQMDIASGAAADRAAAGIGRDRWTDNSPVTKSDF